MSSLAPDSTFQPVNSATSGQTAVNWVYGILLFATLTVALIALVYATPSKKTQVIHEKTRAHVAREHDPHANMADDGLHENYRNYMRAQMQQRQHQQRIQQQHHQRIQQQHQHAPPQQHQHAPPQQHQHAPPQQHQHAPQQHQRMHSQEQQQQPPQEHTQQPFSHTFSGESANSPELYKMI